MGSDTRPRGYSPLRQPSYCGRRPEAVGVAERANDLARGADRLPVVHFVANVVEVEEVVHEVAHDAQPFGFAVRVTESCKLTSFEAKKTASGFDRKIGTKRSEPLDGGRGDAIVIWVVLEREVAVRDEVRKEEAI